MKQIKVEITPREWAEKRMQIYLTTTTKLNGKVLESFDEDIRLCGFVLKEEPEQPKKPITMDDLKEGMRVMLRSDLVDDSQYGGINWTKGMKKGIEVTINTKLHVYFCIEGCSFNYGYSPEMIDYIIE